MFNHNEILHVISVDRASHDTVHLFPQGVRHQCAQCRISLVYVGSGSLYVNLVLFLGRLAAAFDETAPPNESDTECYGVTLECNFLLYK